MIRLLTFLLPLFFALLRPASAQNDSTAAFVVPDTWAAGRTKLDRPVYQIGSTLEVQWTTTDDEYRVILCHISNLTTYSATRGSTIYSKCHHPERHHETDVSQQKHLAIQRMMVSIGLSTTRLSAWKSTSSFSPSSH